MDLLGLQFESALAAFESAFAMNYPRFYPQFESAFAFVRIRLPYETFRFYPEQAETWVTGRTGHMGNTSRLGAGGSRPLATVRVVVIACGRICMHRKRINLSHVLAGQRVGIKEVDEAIWIVSFMHYDLGYIDLEQRTLQPLDNPFGPRLSPMS